MIAVTILYVLFRPDGSTTPAPSSRDTVAWDNPKFTDKVEGTTSISTAYEIQSRAVTDMTGYLTDPDLRDRA